MLFGLDLTKDCRDPAFIINDEGWKSGAAPPISKNRGPSVFNFAGRGSGGLVRELPRNKGHFSGYKKVIFAMKKSRAGGI